MGDAQYRAMVQVFAAATVVAAALDPIVPPVLRIFFGLPFVVFLPGFAILNAFGVVRLRSSILVTVSIGLSLALTVMWGFVLHFVAGLTPLSWSIALTGTTLAAIHWQPDLKLPDFPTHWLEEFRRRPRQRSMVLIALVLMAASIHFAREGAAGYRPHTATEFWMLPSGNGAQNTYTVGIGNLEGQPMMYSFRLALDGEPVDQREGIAVENLKTWTADIRVALKPGEKRRLEAWLVRDDMPDSIYRRIWVSARPTFDLPRGPSLPDKRDATPPATPGLGEASAASGEDAAPQPEQSQ